MDEILIEEKKYVSSKRAAKITGYAKDYVGQLCREGRVPARLVGRSWYVLESAIQDHRFGADTTKPTESHIKSAESHAKIKKEKDETPITTKYSSWESPRYEASKAKLPSYARDEDATIPELRADADSSYKKEIEVTPQKLEDSWREWFDHIEDSAAEFKRGVEPIIPMMLTEKEGDLETVRPELREEARPVEEGAVSVSLRTVSNSSATEKESIPTSLSTAAIPVQRPVALEESEISLELGNNTALTSIIKGVCLLLMLFSVAVAVLNTGYLDKYVTSYKQAHYFSGITTVNK